MSQHATTFLNNEIFVSGGYNSSRLSRAMKKYCPQKEEWIDLKNMNEEHFDHQLIFLNGKIYAIGMGYDDTMECYDP